MNQELLRQIPKVDEVLTTSGIRTLLEQYPRTIAIEAIREAEDRLRQAILSGEVSEISLVHLYEEILLLASKKNARHFSRVINGTGIIVHTNLGRSNLSPKALETVMDAAGHYSNLEYNLEHGTRGSRYSHVEGLICELLGCESALVVNNNAAAVLLVLSAMGNGREAIVSRGELVEIGGSFRVPDIMQQSGCILREVGTTNRTHLRDYEQAVNEQTAMILRVHTSNFRVVGFTKAVPLAELKTLALKAGVPLVEDMGSGLLLDLSRYGLADEPTVQESVAAGVDVVTFSGDKLLGGPQAGIIAGQKILIDLMKQHPLNRALRIDKMTLAALEVTLSHYRDKDEAVQEIPTLRTLAQRKEDLKAKAEKLLIPIKKCVPISAYITGISSQVGGGALPTRELPSYGIVLNMNHYSPDQIEETLRTGNPPIIGRIVKDQYLLDIRTLEEDEFPLIIERIQAMTGFIVPPSGG